MQGVLALQDLEETSASFGAQREATESFMARNPNKSPALGEHLPTAEAARCKVTNLFEL